MNFSKENLMFLYLLPVDDDTDELASDNDDDDDGDDIINNNKNKNHKNKNCGRHHLAAQKEITLLVYFRDHEMKAISSTTWLRNSSNNVKVVRCMI